MMGCNASSKKLDSERENAENEAYLSEAQKVAIYGNWQILKEHVANIGTATYVNMFVNRPELMDVFSTFKGKDLSDLQNSGLLHKHALRVMSTIDKCVEHIDDIQVIRKMLREVGHQHRLYNVPADNMQIILPHFLAAIKPHLLDDWSDDTQEAWTSFLKLIVCFIKDGMKSEKSTEHKIVL